MEIIETYKQIFIKYDGIPDDENSLVEYINFIINSEYKEKDDIEYTELHHIFPTAIYDDVEIPTDIKNIFRLKYIDHIKAHELLFLAYNKRVYARPLQFMKSQLSKNSKLVSNAAKKGWIKLKSDENKYEEFKKKEIGIYEIIKS